MQFPRHNLAAIKKVRETREKAQVAFGRLGSSDDLTPVDFAARAGISVSTVYRLAADHSLLHERLTPHRIRICTWRRKYRKKILDTKNRPKLQH